TPRLVRFASIGRDLDDIWVWPQGVVIIRRRHELRILDHEPDRAELLADVVDAHVGQRLADDANLIRPERRREIEVGRALLAEQDIPHAAAYQVKLAAKVAYGPGEQCDEALLRLRQPGEDISGGAWCLGMAGHLRCG